jgi:hypothetical protein
MQKKYVSVTVFTMLFCGVLFGVSLPAEKASSVNKHTEGKRESKTKLLLEQPEKVPGKLTKPEELLTVELQQIITLLNSKMPNWSSKNKLSANREKIISSFVTSLGMLLKYSPDSFKRPKVNSGFKPLPLLWLQKKRVAYLRIDDFNPEVILQFRQIHDILTANYRLSGIIIDLRNCRSFDYDSGLSCLDQLKKTYKIKSPETLRIALLVGSQTIGVGEYFIHHLKTSFNPIVIGMKSAGQPFEYQSEKLSSGGYILLPRTPSALRDTATFSAQTPTIKVLNNTQRNYKLQLKKPDVTVKYASLLLIALKSTGGGASFEL